MEIRKTFNVFFIRNFPFSPLIGHNFTYFMTHFVTFFGWAWLHSLVDFFLLPILFHEPPNMRFKKKSSFGFAWFNNTVRCLVWVYEQESWEMKKGFSRYLMCVNKALVSLKKCKFSSQIWKMGLVLKLSTWESIMFVEYFFFSLSLLLRAWLENTENCSFTLQRSNFHLLCKVEFRAVWWSSVWSGELDERTKKITIKTTFLEPFQLLEQLFETHLTLSPSLSL